VNKTELIEHIATNADISKAAATRALDAAIGAVKMTLKKGGSVSLVGSAPLRLASGPRVWGVIHALAPRLKLKQPGAEIPTG